MTAPGTPSIPPSPALQPTNTPRSNTRRNVTAALIGAAIIGGVGYCATRDSPAGKTCYAQTPSYFEGRVLGQAPFQAAFEGKKGYGTDNLGQTINAISGRDTVTIGANEAVDVREGDSIGVNVVGWRKGITDSVGTCVATNPHTRVTRSQFLNYVTGKMPIAPLYGPDTNIADVVRAGTIHVYRQK